MRALREVIAQRRGPERIKRRATFAGAR